MKQASAARQIVGVILTQDDLQRAIRMRRPPDLFELRLDALAKSNNLETAVRDLKAPLVVTARHPREGGLNNLTTRERRALLLRFLPYATCLDVELRSAQSFAEILNEARTHRIQTILSFHDLNGTPSRRQLHEIAARTQLLGGDVLKIATRTDTQAELARLRDFLHEHRPATRISIMGIGALGRISRIEFARSGSVLNYAHLGRSQTEGQASIAQLRNALRRK